MDGLHFFSLIPTMTISFLRALTFHRNTLRWDVWFEYWCTAVNRNHSWALATTLNACCLRWTSLKTSCCCSILSLIFVLTEPFSFSTFSVICPTFLVKEISESITGILLVINSDRDDVFHVMMKGPCFEEISNPSRKEKCIMILDSRSSWNCQDVSICFSNKPWRESRP